MKKYRKRPVEVEAVQYTGLNGWEIVKWIYDHGQTAVESPHSELPQQLLIDTREGTMAASIGDYVIRGVKGEFYPCKEDIFEATYDVITDQIADQSDQEGSRGPL